MRDPNRFIPAISGDLHAQDEVHLPVSENDGIRINEFRSLIGSLMYLAHWSRPDILYAVSVLSSNCQFPNQNHWKGINHILAFLGSWDHLWSTFEWKEESNLRVC
jgi:hypothetical protein